MPYSSTIQLLLSIRLSSVSKLLRWYDSHLSCALYALICLNILRYFGSSISDEQAIVYLSNEVGPRKYLPDLASRICSHDITAHFARGSFLTDSFNPNKQRGIECIYENSQSLDPRSVLLVGDSHSYSSLAPMLSLFFRKVHFHWGGYENCSELIESRALPKDCLRIIEVAERFYLRNYCEQST